MCGTGYGVYMKGDGYGFRRETWYVDDKFSAGKTCRKGQDEQSEHRSIQTIENWFQMILSQRICLP